MPNSNGILLNLEICSSMYTFDSSNGKYKNKYYTEFI